MSNSILDRDNWFDKDIEFMISDIIEYDMRRAGLSIIKEEKLLPETDIMMYEAMPKREADIKLGKLQRTNQSLKEGLKNGFKKYRSLFYELNNLSEEDIVSIKKDAIFTKKYCENLQIGENILFVEKHHYEARLYINNCEFYWSSDGQLDVKGIDDESIELHRDYLCNFIWKYIQYLSQYDDEGCLRYIVKFMNDYKFKRLPIEYYREFNQQSLYSYIMYDQPTTSTQLDEVYKQVVLGHYNYKNLFVPMLELVVK